MKESNIKLLEKMIAAAPAEVLKDALVKWLQDYEPKTTEEDEDAD